MSSISALIVAIFVVQFVCFNLSSASPSPSPVCGQDAIFDTLTVTFTITFSETPLDTTDLTFRVGGALADVKALEKQLGEPMAPFLYLPVRPYFTESWNPLIIYFLPFICLFSLLKMNFSAFGVLFSI